MGVCHGSFPQLTNTIEWKNGSVNSCGRSFVIHIFELVDVKGNGHIEFGEFVRSLSIFHPKTPEAVKIKYAFRLYDPRQTGFIEGEEVGALTCTIFSFSMICHFLGNGPVLSFNFVPYTHNSNFFRWNAIVIELVKSYNELTFSSWLLEKTRGLQFVGIERIKLKEMVLACLNESELHLPEDIVESIVDKTFHETDAKGEGKIDKAEWKEYVQKNPSLLRNTTLPYLMQVHPQFNNQVGFAQP
ncbi:EF-hand domain [Dillenia turbinata]|uniref:Calcineurin B-like protein n=1 Tax=Dillenia turbinata TaxID=194707 RepID=A0AAN8UYG1_9MAGN